MDDLGFRRRALAEPFCQNADFLLKKNASAENTHWVNELQMLDQQIRHALQAPVPEGLADRILLRQSLQQKKMQHRQYFYAMAASLMLGLAIVLGTLHNRDAESLQQAVLEHVYSELDHLAEHQDKPLAQVNQLLSPFGGTLNATPGRLHYLGKCDIGKHPGIHMVVPGKQGMITVLMLPENTIAHEQLFSDNRFHGRLIPTARGSIAIVGERGENLRDTQQQLQQTLHWQTPELRNT